MGKKEEVKKVTEVASSIAFGESIVKQKAATGVESNGLYFGFWLPYNVQYSDGKSKIQTRMTVIKPFGKNFTTMNEEKWLMYSKGGERRISEVGIQQLVDDDAPSIDGLELFEDLRKIYTTHIELQEEGNYDYMPLFDMCSYFVPLFDVAPQIHIQGFKMCGKTKLMTASSLLSFNGTLMTSFTLATVFRYVHEASPTLYIDEADKLLKSKKEGIEDVIAMFNSGYKRGAKVPRCDKNNDVQWYDVFGQKVYGSIGSIPDDFASRCHKIIMVRALGESKSAEKPIDERDPKYSVLRSSLYMFALQNWSDLQDLYDNIENGTDLKNRDWEIWKPILVMAKYISEDLYIQMVDFAQESTLTKKEEAENSNDWETILVKALGIAVGTPRYYQIKEIRTIMYDMIDEGDTPSSKWIGAALRKHAFKNFSSLGGLTTVFITPREVYDLSLRHGIKLNESCLTMQNVETMSPKSPMSGEKGDISDKNIERSVSGGTL